MFSSAIIFGVLLWGLQESTGCQFPDYNLSLTSQKEKNGNCTKHVNLENDKRYPIAMKVNHTIDEDRCTEQILITLSAQNFKQSYTIAKDSDIPDGYTFFKGLGSYKIYTNLTTYYDAKERCEADGTHLLVLNSQHEADQVGSLIRSAKTYNYFHWVGVTTSSVKGEYVTIFGQTIKEAGYKTWATPDRPFRVSNYDCVLFISLDSVVGLGDYVCTAPFPAICEKEA